MARYAVWGITKTEIFFVLLIFLVEIFLPVHIVMAADFINPQRVMEQANFLDKQYLAAPEQSVVMLNGAELANAQTGWKAKRREPKATVSTLYMTASAYNSMPNQTDGSPYNTAIGSMTRDGVIGVAASNYLPLGTYVRFPDIFGDKEFRVEDRMNARYDKVIDVWMRDYSAAKRFGRRYVKVEVTKWGLGRGVE